MKIRYQSSSNFRSAANERYRSALQEHVDRIKRPDVEVHLSGVDLKLQQSSNLIVLLNATAPGGILNKVLNAADEGYDAVAIGCYMDPALYEAREASRIPVLGLGETSMHIACMLGARFGIIDFGDKSTQMHERNASVYGLSRRAVHARSMGLNFADVINGFNDATQCIDRFVEQAHLAVRDGAEILLPGCGALDLILLANNVREVEGAPVLPVDATLIKITEVFADLSKLFGVGASRKLLFSSCSEDVLRSALEIVGHVPPCTSL